MCEMYFFDFLKSLWNEKDNNETVFNLNHLFAMNAMNAMNYFLKRH